ncbi:fimbria/pilus outer membrane usher protein [Enterobacter hormaechei]
MQISLNQPLTSGEDNYGSLYVSGTWQDYWNATGSTSNYNIGYNNSFTYGSYSLSLQRTYDPNGKKDDSVYLSLSIPLSVFSKDRGNSGGLSNINMDYVPTLKAAQALTRPRVECAR